MNIEENWNKALNQTEIIRARMPHLATFADTKVKYVFLAESSVNKGDTVVRSGEVVVHKPMLHMPLPHAQFKGFDFDEDLEVSEDTIVNFFLVRGIKLPSMKYDNNTHRLDICEKPLAKAIEKYSDQMQRREDVQTGLMTGPEECWQFSILIYICAQINKSAGTDIKKLFERGLN